MLANIDDSPSKNYLLARGLAERPLPRRSSTTSCSIPTRPRTSPPTRRTPTSCGAARAAAALDGGDGRPAARRPGRAAARAPSSTSPTSARRRRSDRRAAPMTARGRPPDAGRRSGRAARRLGAQRRGFALDVVPRRRRRVRGRTRASYAFVVALGLRRDRRGRRAGVGATARSSGCARPTPPALPVLGICFGAQALASALGGCVHKLPTPEVGWVTVDQQRRRPASPTGPWMAWHEDGFTLPPLAYELASQRVRRAGLLPLPAPRRAVPPRGHAGDRRTAGRTSDHDDLRRGPDSRVKTWIPRPLRRRAPRAPPRSLFDGFAARAGLVAVASRA